jgi:hypothetical protein
MDIILPPSSMTFTFLFDVNLEGDVDIYNARRDCYVSVYRVGGPIESFTAAMIHTDGGLHSSVRDLPTRAAAIEMALLLLAQSETSHD